MKIYAVPDAVPFAAPDYTNGYDFAAENKREAEHQEKLKQHLIAEGYIGKYTGEVARFPHADSYAAYMLADGNGAYGPSFLVHLPYGDAWNDPNVRYLPKKEIVANIERGKNLRKLFASK